MKLDAELLGATRAVTANLDTLSHKEVLADLRPGRKLQAVMLAYGAAFAMVAGLLGMSEEAALVAVKEAVQAQSRAYH